HAVTFLSYYGGNLDPAYERELEREFPGAISICTGKQDLSGARRALDYLVHAGSSQPYAVSRFASRAVRDAIEQCTRDDRFDVAVCDFLDAAVNFPNRTRVPTALFQHNVESEIWRRYAATAKLPLKRAMYRLEFSKMLNYEKRMTGHFDHVIAVS